jgi:toxin ParE1/3/4
MRCEISPLAENDLREIGDYIAIGNPERAVSFIGELLEHSERIASLQSYCLVISLKKNIT